MRLSNFRHFYFMEIWKIIKGFENYAVSNLGNVKNILNNKILKSNNNGIGYYQVRIRNNDRLYKSVYIHRLVAINFIENKTLNKTDINHINGIKSDNNLSNLEWITKSENTKHAYRNKLIPLVTNGKKVVDVKTNKIYKSITMASKELGISNKYLSNMLCGRQKNKTNLKYLKNE